MKLSIRKDKKVTLFGYVIVVLGLVFVGAIVFQFLTFPRGSVLSEFSDKKQKNSCVTYLVWRDKDGNTSRIEPYYATDDPKVIVDVKTCYEWAFNNFSTGRACGYSKYVSDENDTRPYENPQYLAAFLLPKPTKPINSFDELSSPNAASAGSVQCFNLSMNAIYRESESMIPRAYLNSAIHTKLPIIPTPTPGKLKIPSCVVFRRRPPSPDFAHGEWTYKEQYTKDKAACKVFADQFAAKRHCGIAEKLFGNSPDVMIAALMEDSRHKSWLQQNLNMETEFVARYTCNN